VTQPLDLRVSIDRVRVRAGSPPDTRPAPAFVVGYGGRPPGASPHDHRIVIRELRLDVEATLDASTARHLGKQVASELVDRLAAHQRARLRQASNAPAAAPRAIGGPICVETVHVRLWGDRSHQLAAPQIADAAMTAFEAKVRDAA
jgi:hypothetical protein